ncbi:MAG: hypothetical protein M3Z37_03655 [Candidatus Eremiobacteraeota bacterium]|nr:hypothetical protein [Candidatus Eremiobacteraeota bacterium]
MLGWVMGAPVLWVRYSVYAIVACLLLRPFFAHPTDCVFGLHDWAFPCFDEQRSHFFTYWLSPLSAHNLGSPQPRPTVEPPLLLLFAAASVAPAVALRAFLFICFFSGALAADYAVATLYKITSPWARFAAGLVYMCSPFFQTKLVSGHIGFLVCAPLIPLALSAFDALRVRSGSWAVAAAFISASFAQLQVGLVMLAILPVMAWRGVSAAKWLGIWAIALLTWAPVAFAGIVAYYGGALSTETQLHAWLLNESVPWQHALDGTEYFTHYFRDSVGAPSAVAWQLLSPMCLLYCLFLPGTPRRLSIVAIVLAFVSAGLRGPLAPIVQWSMAHIDAMTLFRELYDLLFLAPLAIAGGAAAGMQRLIQRSRRGAIPPAVGYALGVALMLLLIWPALSAALAQRIPFVTTARWKAQAAEAALSAPYDRILWLPTAVPLGPDGTPGGADPFSFPFGDHPSVNAYHPFGLFAYVSALADRTGSLDAPLAHQLGIGKVFVRSGVVSRRLVAAEHPLGAEIRVPRHEGERDMRTSLLAVTHSPPQCEPDLRTAMRASLAYVRCASNALIVAPHEDPESDDDPLHAWVSGERWAELDPALAQPRWPVIFTLSPRAHRWYMPLPGVTWIYAPAGAWVDARPMAASGSWQSVKLTHGQHSARGDGKHLVAVSASLTAASSNVVGRGVETDVALQKSDPAMGRFAAVIPPGSAFVILREQWAPLWRAYLDGRDLGVPKTSDGYALGWLLPARRGPSQLVVRYQPTVPYVALAGTSWLIWLCLALSISARLWTARPRR